MGVSYCYRCWRWSEVILNYVNDKKHSKTLNLTQYFSVEIFVMCRYCSLIVGYSCLMSNHVQFTSI